MLLFTSKHWVLLMLCWDPSMIGTVLGRNVDLDTRFTT